MATQDQVAYTWRAEYSYFTLEDIKELIAQMDSDYRRQGLTPALPECSGHSVWGWPLPFSSRSNT